LDKGFGILKHVRKWHMLLQYDLQNPFFNIGFLNNSFGHDSVQISLFKISRFFLLCHTDPELSIASRNSKYESGPISIKYTSMDT